MAKLHTYYITNAKNELKYSYTGLSEDTFHSTIQEAINRARTSDDFNDDEEYDEEYEDESDDEEYDGESCSDIEEEEENDNDNVQRNIAIENWINMDDPELKKLLDVEVNVVIEPHPLVIDHGSNVFNIEAVVDGALPSIR